MDFSYEASGSLTLSGRSKNNFFKYRIGATAYLWPSVLQDRLEKVAIKKKYLNKNTKLYQDTYNAVFLEEELLTLEEAEALLA